MENFYIDKLSNEEFSAGYESPTENESDEDHLNIKKIDLFDLPDNSKKIKSKNTKKISLSDTYLISSYKNKAALKVLSKADKLLEKSVINKGLEKHLCIPPEKSKKALKLEKKKLREKTKGENWFGMPATELTDEIKTDFEVLKMRSVLDRKHVYKKNDITHMPKYFQVGRVVEGAADFYGGRIPKSQRKKTMVEELLADAEFKKYQKKKFKEIMDENRRKKRNKNFGGNKVQKKKSKR